MKFVRVEYDNNRVAGAELTSHREVIEEYALKGYKYLGFEKKQNNLEHKTIYISSVKW